MKKGQTALEYVLFLLLSSMVIILLAGALWNRDAIINSGTFGAKDQHGRVHVRPMLE